MENLCPFTTSITPQSGHFFTQTFAHGMRHLKVLMGFCLLFFATNTIWGQCSNITLNGTGGTITINGLVLGMPTQIRVVTSNYVTVATIPDRIITPTTTSATIANVAAGSYFVDVSGNINAGVWCGTGWKPVTIIATTTCPTPTLGFKQITSSTVTQPLDLYATGDPGVGFTFSKIEYYNNGTLLGTGLANTRFIYTWTPTTVGTYTITAKATNTCGNSSPTITTTITISAANNSTGNALCTANMFTNCTTGQLSIGLNNFGNDTSYKLFVNGGIKATKIKVELPQNGTTWPDYVFDPTYNLLPLSKVEQFIQNNHHLPNMPSANELQKDGVDLLGIITKQQEKIEELYLHIIALEKAIQSKK
jgi:hypothetical protein